MGMLIAGEWIDDDSQYRDVNGGAFLHAEMAFTDRVTADGSSGFAAEAGRYHIFASAACPWAHRTLIIRRLKGLEGVVSMSLADLPAVRSWAFSAGIGRDLKPVNGVFELHRAYLAARPDFTGRVTVPTLWDKQRWTIVNNDSAQIIRMLNSEFDALRDSTIDLYPAGLRDDIDRVNERVFSDINIGVYACGLAKSQGAYDEAFGRLFAALDFVENLLSTRRYLCGNRITEADWKLYTTLVRFDAVYFGAFKCNRQRVSDFNNLSNYLRELHQWPGIAELTDMPAIKRVYYSMPYVNPSGIIPNGPADLNLDGRHNRDRFPLADGRADSPTPIGEGARRKQDPGATHAS